MSEEDSLKSIIDARKDYEGVMQEMFLDFPRCDKATNMKEFLIQLHEQSEFLQNGERLSLIKESFTSSGGSTVLDLKKKIVQLEGSLKQKD